MSLATLVGAALAYPINWWLVKNGLKHGMGTARVLGRGGTRVGASAMSMPMANQQVLTAREASKGTTHPVPPDMPGMNRKTSSVSRLRLTLDICAVADIQDASINRLKPPLVSS